MRAKRTDLVGQKFGMLTVLEDSGQRTAGKSILWRCRCDCGEEKLAVRSDLTSGNMQNCGCVPKMRAPRNIAEDLTGRQFGDLTVLRRAPNDKDNRVCWVCLCSCGKECVVKARNLKRGNTKSCGCRKHRTPCTWRDLTGMRFGRLEVLYPEESRAKSIWHCRCDCGREVGVFADNLLRGLTKSCGCLNREKSANMHDHMHYQDDTCLERLKRVTTDQRENKAGFRGLFLTKSGKYRVMITFRKVHYTLGYYQTYEEAVRVRLDAEEHLHNGYLAACQRYEEHARADPQWAEENPFYYDVVRRNGDFQISTNGV